MELNHKEIVDNSTWKPNEIVESFQFITKDKGQPNRRPRVYFTCHPDDFEKCFKKICDDFFKTQDCVIFYTENMDADYSDTIWDTDLAEMNLFVVPVTYKLLRGGNRTTDVDVPYAFGRKIPVLPILMEPGKDLKEMFGYVFGKIQYLNPEPKDSTEIPYEDKLKNRLDVVLVGNELKEKIQSAFDAYIFLSYRKKDRVYANQVMQIIHNHPFFRDIAIWYDEYLTPGENFEQEIQSAMNKSALIVLLVTNHLLENPNYVMKIEYPEARQRNKEILPIEVQKTNRSELEVLFASIPPCVVGEEGIYSGIEHALRKEILNKDYDSEHNYLIGMAYLNGIDVEKNVGRAFEMILGAAEGGVSDAIGQIAEMYHSGMGVECDQQKWIEWLNKGILVATKEYGPEDERVLSKMEDLAAAYGSLYKYQDALELYKKVYEIRKKVQGEEHLDTLRMLHSMAYTYGEMGDYKTKYELEKKIYESQKKVLGEEHSATSATLNNMVITYLNMGYYEKAIGLGKKAYESTKKVLGEEHPDTLTILSNMASTYGKLGDYKTEFELLKKSI